ncbi:MAG TPA: hypothetical protein VJ948_05605 [Acidimicrobiia bacterium]|nr:hypothetical protein [Acidimicrobiia bacterium]
MRRLTALVAFLVLVPATSALGTELGELLERSQDASYSAEQIISCVTPDGARDALVSIDQSGGELRVSSSVTGDVEVTAGSGEWTLTRHGNEVAEASVGGGSAKSEPLYTVEDRGEVDYLGRDALAYLLVRDGQPRAELLVDEETGAFVEAVTLDIDGEIYCERRFVSFQAGETQVEELEAQPEEGLSPTVASSPGLPEELAGFELLDQYADEDGVRFAYYSDGFFSFAVFETEQAVALPGAATIELGSGSYRRVFTAGQVTYVWETLAGGLALVGDLPPDLHEAVLAELPHPQDPGFFRRWWRNLFGYGDPPKAVL